jgi:hypothetical protein
MSTKKEKFIPLPPGTRLIGWVREPFRWNGDGRTVAEWIQRRTRERVYRFERGWYYLQERKVRPDEIGPGKQWEIDPDPID